MSSRAHSRGLLRLATAGLGALAISVPGLACGDGDEESAGTTGPLEQTTAPAAETTAGDEAATAPDSVEAFDFGFGPEETTIETGDTVTWENTGDTIHTVKGQGFFSDGMNPGDSYKHKFTEPGTYEYLCTLHPDQMLGTVVVK